MRAVLDTNIVISMALGGQVGKINDYWKQGKFVMVVTDVIVSEYLDVLQRPKLRLSGRTIALIMGRVYRKAEFASPIEQIHEVKADSSDNKFLEAAVAGKVEFIVSGDNHLLEFEKFRSIPIISAREFLEWLEANT